MPLERREKYTVTYWLGVVVTVVAGGVAALVTQADAIGLTRAQLGELAVLAAMLTILNGLLPRVSKPPSDSRAGQD